MSSSQIDHGLQPELLYMFVFGPGRGECVVVRVPPETWLVLDSCWIAEECPALALLAEYDGRWSAAILTHRHSDHIDGFAEVLQQEGGEVIGCADPMVTRRDKDQALADVEAYASNGTLEEVVAAISTRWKAEPSSRWETYRGTERRIGEALLHALHPSDAYVKEHPNDRSNFISSAFLLEWRGLRLLLGGDVEKNGWEEISQSYSTLGEHHGLKIPHHCSREAIHDCYSAGDPNRSWVASPWNGRGGPPRFEDGQGVHLLLQSVSKIHLSGLPVRHDRQHESPCHSTRREVFAGVVPRPIKDQLPDGTPFTHLPIAGHPMSNFVAIGFDGKGAVREVRYGAGAMVVQE